MTTLKRYNSIRRTDNTNDQLGSVAILSALGAVTQEDFQTYFLSRLRQVIYGESSSEHWYSDFLGSGILSLKDLSSSLTLMVRIGVSLSGLKDGANRNFSTPEYFVHDPLVSGRTITVIHNGRVLVQTDTQDPSLGDYYVSESGGVGTGFDSVTLLTFAPVGESSLVATYYRA